MGKCSSEHREKDQKRMSALQNLTLLKLKLNLKIINKNGSRNIVRSFYYPDSSTVSKEKNIESNIKSNLEKSKIDQSVGAASFNENSQIQPMINTANRANSYKYYQKESQMCVQNNYFQENESAKVNNKFIRRQRPKTSYTTQNKSSRLMRGNNKPSKNNSMLKIAFTSGGGLTVESSDPRRKLSKKGLQTACVLPQPKIMFNTHKLSTAIRREVQEFKLINQHLSAFTPEELNNIIKKRNVDKVISEEKIETSAHRKPVNPKPKFNRKSLHQLCESHAKRKSSLQSAKDKLKLNEDHEDYIRITSRVDWDSAEYLRENQKK